MTVITMVVTKTELIKKVDEQTSSLSRNKRKVVNGCDGEGSLDELGDRHREYQK